jgi:hypothetical protein
MKHRPHRVKAGLSPAIIPHRFPWMPSIDNYLLEKSTLPELLGSYLVSPVFFFLFKK